MFGMSLAELVIVGILALIVVGPDKLPSTIKTLAATLSKIRAQWTSAKRDISNELGLDEIQRDIHNAEILAQLKKKANIATSNMDNNIADSISNAYQDDPDEDESLTYHAHHPSPDHNNKNTPHE